MCSYVFEQILKTLIVWLLTSDRTENLGSAGFFLYVSSYVQYVYQINLFESFSTAWKRYAQQSAIHVGTAAYHLLVAGATVGDWQTLSPQQHDWYV